MKNFSLEEMYIIAFCCAKYAHQGQYDKQGKEYFNHPLTVSGFVKDPEAKIVALLHDTIEDTCIQREDLAPVFGTKIADEVQILTHKANEDYFAYIERVCKNPVTIQVKLADLKHNMDPNRVPKDISSDKYKRRMEKYRKAKSILTNALASCA